MRSLIKAVLQTNFGVSRVFEAGDGERAFAIFKVNELDLIITDIAMEPGSGRAISWKARNISDRTGAG